jgi:hypothetical protein
MAVAVSAPGYKSLQTTYFALFKAAQYKSAVTVYLEPQ